MRSVIVLWSNTVENYLKTDGKRTEFIHSDGLRLPHIKTFNQVETARREKKKWEEEGHSVTIKREFY